MKIKTVARPDIPDMHMPTAESVADSRESLNQLMEKLYTAEKPLSMHRREQIARLHGQSVYLMGDPEGARKYLAMSVDLRLGYIRQCTAETEKLRVLIGGKEREVYSLNEHAYAGPYYWASAFNIALATGDRSLVERVLATDIDRWRGVTGIPYWWAAYDYYRALLASDEAGRRKYLDDAAAHAGSGSTIFIGLKGTKPIRSGKIAIDLCTNELPVLVLLEHAASGRIDEFNALLLDRLRKKRAKMIHKNYYPSRDDYFDWPALGAVVVARHLGVPIAVSSDYIPEDLQGGVFGLFGVER